MYLNWPIIELFYKYVPPQLRIEPTIFGHSIIGKRMCFCAVGVVVSMFLFQLCYKILGLFSPARWCTCRIGQFKHTVCLTIWYQLFLEFLLVHTLFNKLIPSFLPHLSHPRHQRAVTCLENVRQLNERWGKKLDINLLNRQPQVQRRQPILIYMRRFAQFATICTISKRENSHGGVLRKVALFRGFFFTFLKLHRWYQIVQSMTILCSIMKNFEESRRKKSLLSNCEFLLKSKGSLDSIKSCRNVAFKKKIILFGY